MHAKPDLRVFLKWIINRSGSVITDVMSLKNMIRYAMLFVTLATLVGCSKPELHSLQKSYTTPDVPAGLEEFHTAQPNTKLYDNLPADNKTISLHEYYRGGHRDGWDQAFQDWRLKREFQTDEECAMISMIGVWVDGRVAGYNAAKIAIEYVNVRE